MPEPRARSPGGDNSLSTEGLSCTRTSSQSHPHPPTPGLKTKRLVCPGVAEPGTAHGRSPQRSAGPRGMSPRAPWGEGRARERRKI